MVRLGVVDGEVHEIGAIDEVVVAGDAVVFLYNVDCLVNSVETNSVVNLAVNSVEKNASYGWMP